MLSPEVVKEVDQILHAKEAEVQSTSPFVFAVVYGSSAYGAGSETSDIDMFFVCPEGTTPVVNFGELKDSVLRLHHEQGRNIDDEVPHENKLLYCVGDLRQAFCLEAFEDGVNGLAVPKVVKTPEFLGSKGIKLRLALNALTTPHLIFSREPGVSDTAVRCAETCCTLLGASLTRSQRFTAGEIFDILSESCDGETGEDYLGYKTDNPVVAEYLRSVVNRSLEGLKSAGFLTSDRKNRFVIDDAFCPRAIMASFVSSARFGEESYSYAT